MDIDLTADFLLYKFMSTERFHFFFKPTLRFTPIKDLNDPFEGFLAYRPLSKEDYQNGSEIPISEPMYEMFESANKNYHNLNAEAAKQLFTDKGVGILSLTKAYNSELLWSHYARNHRGFVVGVDKTHSFFSRDDHQQSSCFVFDKVKYSDKRPVLAGVKADLTDESIRNLFFRKSSSWEYEAEWRVVLDNNHYLDVDEKAGIVDLPLPAIKVILLGINVDLVVRESALRFGKENNIPVKYATFHIQKYEIEFDDASRFYIEEIS